MYAPPRAKIVYPIPGHYIRFYRALCVFLPRGGMSALASRLRRASRIRGMLEQAAALLVSVNNTVENGEVGEYDDDPEHGRHAVGERADNQ